METQASNAKLFAKIASVMKQVRTLEKTGRNQFDKYDYVTADAIATKIGTALAENGLAFFPSLVTVETSDYTTKSGGSNFRTVVHMQMTLACTESGATYTSLWSGEAIDRSDKSISKAAVSAVKYYLLKTFLLAGGDEDDADAASPTTDIPQPAAKPAQKPTTTSKVAGEHNDEGDVLFEPAKSKRPVLSNDQEETVMALGKTFYGDNWPKEQVRLANYVSKGDASRIADLVSKEAEKLIAGLRKEIAQAEQEATQAEPEKVTA